jgi:hypothetical protein
MNMLLENTTAKARIKEIHKSHSTRKVLHQSGEQGFVTDSIRLISQHLHLSNCLGA